MRHGPRRPNPWFSPPAFQYVAWPNPPEEGGSFGQAFGRLSDEDKERFHQTLSRSRCNECGEILEECECGEFEDLRFNPARSPHRPSKRFRDCDAYCRECGEESDCNCVERVPSWPEGYRSYNPGYLGPIQGSPWPSMNPVEFHPGGSHRYRGRHYPGSGRRHHHGRPPTQFHPGGGVRYRGEYHPGGGHYEANPVFGFGGPPEPPPEREWFAANPFGLEVGPPEPPPEREWFAANPGAWDPHAGLEVPSGWEGSGGSSPQPGSVRCAGRTQSGQRCKRRVTGKSKLCPSHQRASKKAKRTSPRKDAKKKSVKRKATKKTAKRRNPRARSKTGATCAARNASGTKCKLSPAKGSKLCFRHKKSGRR